MDDDDDNNDCLFVSVKVIDSVRSFHIAPPRVLTSADVCRVTCDVARRVQGLGLPTVKSTTAATATATATAVLCCTGREDCGLRLWRC